MSSRSSSSKEQRCPTVWIFNPYDDVVGEGPPQRFWALAEALSEEGCSVVWWSSRFSHRRKQYREIDTQLDQAFELRLVDTPAYHKNISWARVRNHRVYGDQLYRDACFAVDSGDLPAPDVILASLPPMEGPSVALQLKERFGCKVVTDVMDAWPDTLLQILPNYMQWLGRLALTPYFRMLRRVCCDADAISAQSNAFVDYARAAGARGESYVCYLGGTRLSSIRQQANDEHRTKIRLLYLGAMGRSYDLDTVLDALLLLESRGLSVECTFVGDGPKRAQLEARALSNVRFTGFLDGDALAAELTSADLGLVPFYNSSKVAVPYKAGEYLAYGTPLLSTIDGELGSLIRKYRCGKVYSESRPEALANAIEEYAREPDLLADAKKQAHVCFDSHFDRSKIYPEYAKWLMSIAHR